jgi:hypothetical protein
VHKIYAPDTPAGHEVARILETRGQLRAESDQRKWMIEDQSTGSNASSGLNPCIIQVYSFRHPYGLAPPACCSQSRLARLVEQRALFSHSRYQPKIIPSGDCFFQRSRRKKGTDRRFSGESFMSGTASPKTEKRNEKRFQIFCPILVMLRVGGRTTEGEQGHLCDIGTKGARFQFRRELSVGEILTLLVHFPDCDDGVTTVRFTGMVIRTQVGPPFEIAVRFRRGGRFLRDRLKGLRSLGNLTAPQRRSSWIN